MRNIRLLVIIFFTFWLTGCGMTAHHRLYNIEQQLPTTQIAILKGDMPLILYEIDGKPGPNFAGAGYRKRYNSKWDGTFIIDLLPGTHILKVGYLHYSSITETYSMTETYSISDVVVTLEAKPGSVYVIEAERSGDSWKPIVQQIK